MSQLVKKIRTSAGDLPIDYNALANLPTISNPNLLINSDFRNPVNQRGQTSYIGGEQKYYTIDRWCMGENDFNRTVEVVSGGVKIINPNTSYNGTFQQIFENTLPHGTYTISVNVIAKNGNAIMYCTGSHGSTKKNLVIGMNTLTLTGATINAVRIETSPSSDITLEWMKLEVGSVATQFSPKTYAQELSECQRYFTILGGIRAPGVEQDKNANTFTYSIPRNCMMRTIPSISIRGTTTTNSTDGICVRTIGCAVIPGFTFEYSVQNWELWVVAKHSGPLTENCYETQLFINNAFKICLDAEIY